MSLPAVFTVDEVAERLHKSRRWVMSYVRSRNIGGKAGRTRLFTDEDILQIELALRRSQRPPQHIIDAYLLLPNATDKHGSVYFIEAGGFIKIGHSKDWKGRLRGLSGSSPLPLAILYVTRGGHEKERALHRKFQHCRSHGEWFHKAPDLLAYIDLLKKDGA
jgi:hypothetical protein